MKRRAQVCRKRLDQVLQPIRTSPRPMFFNDRSIISSIYTRLSIDVAGVPLRHVVLDEYGRYAKDLTTPLNDCLTLEPNMDQGPRSLRHDVAMTPLDRGVAAIVPVDLLEHKGENKGYDVYSLRVGEIVQWYPNHVRVNLYNEKTGRRQEILLEKNKAAIVQNPFFSVMNEPNSTLQRLTRKLHLLDVVDEQSSSRQTGSNHPASIRN